MRQIIPSRIWRRASHPLGKAVPACRLGRCFKRLCLLRSPLATRTPWPAQRAALSALLRRTTWQTRLVKSSLPACPVLPRCRSACKRFLPDFLRRMAFSWCARVVAALPRKSILTCSRSCGFQGALWFCKKLRAFKNAKGFVSESSPYTLYKLKGVFLNGVLWKFGKFSLFQTTSYTYNILKRVFGNLIFKFYLNAFSLLTPIWIYRAALEYNFGQKEKRQSSQ